jgi:hypothetical protein
MAQILVWLSLFSSFVALAEDVEVAGRSFESEVQKFNQRKESVPVDPKDPTKTKEIVVVEDLESKLRAEMDLLPVAEIELLDLLDCLDAQWMESYALKTTAVKLQQVLGGAKDADLEKIESLFTEKTNNLASLKARLNAKFGELKIRDIGLDLNKAHLKTALVGTANEQALVVPFSLRLFYKGNGIIRPSGTSYVYGELRLSNDFMDSCAADVKKCVPSSDGNKGSHARWEVTAVNFIIGEGEAYAQTLSDVEMLLSAVFQYEIADEIYALIKSQGNEKLAKIFLKAHLADGSEELLVTKKAELLLKLKNRAEAKK